METSLLSMLHELNSFVSCTQHFKAAAESGITVSNNKKFAGLVKEYSAGDYDECPDLLVQRLTHLIH
jgi:hypothetical protein